jgi:hypothetical protein
VPDWTVKHGKQAGAGPSPDESRNYARLLKITLIAIAAARGPP